MRLEKSCGAVILREDDGEWMVLLVRHSNGGHWSFPKGHMELGETEQQTAQREVLEETGLSITINTDFRATTVYSPYPEVEKEVVFFLSLVLEDHLIRQEAEITDIRWSKLEDAPDMITFESDQRVLVEALTYFDANRLV